MSVGVSRAIGWRPAELGVVAKSWDEKSRAIDGMAVVVRDKVDRGTDGQSGEFIDRVRWDGESARSDAVAIAKLLESGAAVLRKAEADIAAAVTTLCRVVDDARDLDFTVKDDGTVRDSRSSKDDEPADANARENRRAELQNDAVGALRDLAEADAKANRELHDLVGRQVRDRTKGGNWDPTSTYGAAAVSAATGLFGGAYNASVAAGDIPTSPRWWNQARNFGLFGNVIGFFGGWASAPDDEPLHETLTAEGLGAVAGTAGSMLGGPFASKIAKVLNLGAASPAAGLAGEVGGGMLAGLVTSGVIREGFDNAN